MTAIPLTANECTQLGGGIYSDPAGLCKSSTLCLTHDQAGHTHRVCINEVPPSRERPASKTSTSVPKGT